jgi:hypothetical protein
MATKMDRRLTTHFEQVPVEVAQAAAMRSATFPLACPHCARLDGFPFCARTMLGAAGVQVDMRCRTCGHEWQVDRPAPPMGGV